MHDSETAVVRGAVYKAMGLGSDFATKVRICPRHYGICLSEPYQEWRHLQSNVTTNRFNNREVVQDQIVWLVKQGDVILSSFLTKKSINFQGYVTNADYRRGVSLRLAFVATAAPEAPSSMTELDMRK